MDGTHAEEDAEEQYEEEASHTFSHISALVPSAGPAHDLFNIIPNLRIFCIFMTTKKGAWWYAPLHRQEKINKQKSLVGVMDDCTLITREIEKEDIVRTCGPGWNENSTDSSAAGTME